MSDAWKKRLADHSAADGLVPLEALDPKEVRDFDGLLGAMARTSFGGRRLGEAAEVLEAMVRDPECRVVLTLSGAMTVAKMNLVIAEMIERGWVDAVVSTGALMTHGLVELAGMNHYKARSGVDDARLFERGYNRVYDTYELEANLNRLGEVVARHIVPRLRSRFGSVDVLRTFGAWLDEMAPGARGPVAEAFRRDVPIFVPAFTDSEMGLEVCTAAIARRMDALGCLREEAMDGLQVGFDAYRDLIAYTRFVADAPKLGIFTIGGGVPRNWAQQAPPFLDCLSEALRDDGPRNRFTYGVRICPEPVHWGGLSGCSYREGVSWGKFAAPAEGGRYAEVHADATTVWPLLVAGVAQRLDRG